MTPNPIPRDYWLVADTREQVRELSNQLIRQSGLDRGQAVRYLDYLGEQGRWCACVTIVTSDHDSVRAVHGRMMQQAARHAPKEQLSYTEAYDHSDPA